MADELFRKKSLERISSPEQLHDYMRVTTPRLWMILGAIVALLLGFIAYATTATVENTITIPLKVSSENTWEQVDGELRETGIIETTCFGALPISYLDVVETGMEVRFGEERGKVSIIFVSSQDETHDVEFLVQMDNSYIPVPDGTYDAELVLESAAPISFLWN